MTKTKKNKMPELARWRYNIQIDVEGTKRNADNRGFSCRTLEGQPKNKRGKNGWGELYPLNQYEITGGDFSPNSKIHIAPKTTQIFFFGNEIQKPLDADLKEFERFLDCMEPLLNDLEKTEKIMNDLAAFVPHEKNRFGLSTRINAKVPAMYRLIQDLKDTNQEVFDELMNRFWVEVEKAYADMFQGKAYLASKRLELLISELTFFQQHLINMAKEWKDPRAEQWESRLRKSLSFPIGFFTDGRGE